MAPNYPASHHLLRRHSWLTTAPLHGAQAPDQPLFPHPAITATFQ